MVKKIINNLSGKDVNSIVSELIHTSYYYNNTQEFYRFFGLQGGTCWILASYILEYKKGRL
jgi:hypothetical protein